MQLRQPDSQLESYLQSIAKAQKLGVLAAIYQLQDFQDSQVGPLSDWIACPYNHVQHPEQSDIFDSTFNCTMAAIERGEIEQRKPYELPCIEEQAIGVTGYFINHHLSLLFKIFTVNPY